MKEELQGKLVEILTSIQTSVGRAESFAMEQLPDIAQSYVAYGRVSGSVVVAAFALVFLTAMFVTLRYGYYNKAAVHDGGSYHRKGEWREHRVFAAIIGTVVSAVLFGALVANLHGLLLVWLAPKVWLLKEIATLLK